MVATQKRKLICLDFDGVLHSYSSGWEGPRTISDTPVDGALEFIVRALDYFHVCIFSSRSAYWFGRMAMKKWLRNEYKKLAVSYDTTPTWLNNHIAKTAFADPWDDEVRYSIGIIINSIRWPKYKPTAHITLDDRSFMFTGKFPNMNDLIDFKPWNKK